MDEIESLVDRYHQVNREIANLRRGQDPDPDVYDRIRELEDDRENLLPRIYAKVASKVFDARAAFNKLHRSFDAVGGLLADAQKCSWQLKDITLFRDESPADARIQVPLDVDRCLELYKKSNEMERIADEISRLAKHLEVKPTSPSDRQCPPSEPIVDEPLGDEPLDEKPQGEEPQGDEPLQGGKPQGGETSQAGEPSHAGEPSQDDVRAQGDENPQEDEQPQHEPEREPGCGLGQPTRAGEGVNLAPGQELPNDLSESRKQTASSKNASVLQIDDVAEPPGHSEPGDGLSPVRSDSADSTHAPAIVDLDAVIRRAAEFAKDPKTFPECWFFIEFLARRHPGLEGLGTLPTRELLELGYHCRGNPGVELGIDAFQASTGKVLDEVFSQYRELALPQRLMALAVSVTMLPFSGLGANVVDQVVFDQEIPSSLRSWARIASMFWAAHRRPFERPGLDPKAWREERRRQVADALKAVFESGRGMNFKFHLGNAVKHRLFPVHGRGELGWILDEVGGKTACEPSRRIQEWQRDFMPGDYLDRVARDAMGPSKAKDIEGGARKRLLNILEEIHRLVTEWIQTFDDPKDQASCGTSGADDPFGEGCRTLCREFSRLAPKCRSEVAKLSDGEFGVAKAWLERALTVFAGRLGGQEEQCRP